MLYRNKDVEALLPLLVKHLLPTESVGYDQKTWTMAGRWVSGPRAKGSPANRRQGAEDSGIQMGQLFALFAALQQVPVAGSTVCAYRFCSFMITTDWSYERGTGSHYVPVLYTKCLQVCHCCHSLRWVCAGLHKCGTGD